MNINENQEFEAINSKVKERSVNVEEVRQSAAETYREVKARKKAKALGRIFVAVVMFAMAVVVFYGLESIGWINSTFHIVLMCIAGAVTMFNIGLRWNELKQ
jgi:Na+/proline symporter